MDIELLSRMLGVLVLDNERVGLPGLGSFVSENVGASFSDRGYTINPPYRRLDFSMEASDDLLIAQMYAEANGLSPRDAERIIRDFVSTIRKDLNERHTVIFPGLGRLRSTSRGQVFFVCDEAFDVFPEGMMLPSLSLKNHSDEEVISRIRQDAAMTLAEISHTEPESVPSPIQDVEPVFVPELEPELELDSDSVSEPEFIPASGQEAETTLGSGLLKEEETIEIKPMPKVKKKKNWWWILTIVLVSLAILALIVFIMLCNIAPDFVDHLLYTEEELKIINY